MLRLESTEVHVWHRHTYSIRDDIVASANKSLSAEEHARRDRLYFEADRRDFTMAHDLLRRALSHYKEVPPSSWRFVTNEFGKPFVAGHHLKDLSFSLSHTKGSVACAITSHSPVGVDIERTDRQVNVTEMAELWFSESERAWLRDVSDELSRLRFTQLWTLKEAYLKATGIGLSGSLVSPSFYVNDGQVFVDCVPTVQHRNWHFASFDIGHSVQLGLAVCASDKPPITVRNADIDSFI